MAISGLAQPPTIEAPRINPQVANVPNVSIGTDVTLIPRRRYSATPVTWQWQLNGRAIAGANQDSLFLQDVQLDDSGDYTLVGRNEDGETVSPPLNLVVDPTFVSLSILPAERLFSGEWIDVDGDGWLDLSGLSTRTEWVVLLNSRDGGFVPGSRWPMSAFDSLFYRGFGDYDNDGDQDMVGGSNLPTMSFENTGGSTFTARGNLEGQTVGVPIWIDIDGDGFLDLYRPQWVGWALVHLNHRQGPPDGFRVIHHTSVGEPLQVLAAIRNFHVPAWADFDGDGRLDVYVTGYDQPGRLYRSLGGGAFEHVASNVVNPTLTSIVADWVDYDGDADLDLVINPLLRGALRVYRNNGGGTFTDLVRVERDEVLVRDVTPNSCAMAWGDFDNDGDLDLYRTAFGWSDSPELAQEPGRLLVNDGSGHFQRQLVGSPTTGMYDGFFMASWGDYNNDGFLDLFGTMHPGSGTVIHRNNLPNAGNGNHWLKVKCVGRVSNRDAVGTQVRVKATLRGESRWQLRQVMRSGGGGPLITHFGLADAPVVEVLRVEWPSGAVQEFRDLAVNQSLVIEEPPRLTPSGPTSFTVGCWKGMGFDVEASVDLENWTRVGSVQNVDGTPPVFSDAVPKHGACRFYRVVER